MNRSPSPQAAIIGTRDPSPNQRQAACYLAYELSRRGWTIRTGAAVGIDQEAMQATSTLHPNSLVAVLPWASYNQALIPTHATRVVYNPEVDIEWTNSVTQFHPAHHRLSKAAFALHARNYGIVAPTWVTLAFPRADSGGGTAQGVRIARFLKIPLYEFPTGHPCKLTEMEDLVHTLTTQAP